MTVASVVSVLTRQMIGADLNVRSAVAIGVALELLGIGLGAAGPYFLKWLVDALTARDQDFATLLALVAAFVVTWSGTSVVSTCRMVFSAKVDNALCRHLSLQALAGGLPRSAAARDGDSGRVLGLLERLPYSLQVVNDGLIWRAFPLVLQVIVTLALVGGLIPLRYVGVLSVVFVGFVLATWLGATRHRRYSDAANAVAASGSQTLGDILRNSRRVILNGALDIELKTVGAQFDRKRVAEVATIWSLVRMTAAQYGVVGSGLLFLLGMAAADVVSGTVTVGDFILLQAYAFRLAMPLAGFGYVLSQAGVAVANIGDVFDLISPPAVGKAQPGQVRGPADIVLKGASFSYGAGLSDIEAVSAEFPKGSFSVIVGPNGSGKSTLAQVIAGVLEAPDGTVVVNGVAMNAVSRADRYRLVLYVPQFIGLFNRSLGENALYPQTNRTEADIQQLLTEWQFYEAGRLVDLGIAVGEQGERLSGGQIQKLELARLTGVRVPGIILDESTSSLDPQSEATVIGSLRRHLGSSTTLIAITHRPALAAMADQVLFMQAGRLVAVGAHDELMAAAAGYADLWNLV